MTARMLTLQILTVLCACVVLLDTGAARAQTGTFTTTTPDAVLRHKRALYAVSIDEPLIAPAGAAIDVQLTFKRCHGGVGHPKGCPMTPNLQQWRYDPPTHRLLHAASGKCLNISGARHDAGAPIILYPCSGAPNEKWTLVQNAASALWSIKSDLNGMCLQAKRGPLVGGIQPLEPATLVQMPCDGGSAQRFDDADAAWSQRNGPR